MSEGTDDAILQQSFFCSSKHKVKRIIRSDECSRLVRAGQAPRGTLLARQLAFLRVDGPLHLLIFLPDQKDLDFATHQDNRAPLITTFRSRYSLCESLPSLIGERPVNLVLAHPANQHAPFTVHTERYSARRSLKIPFVLANARDFELIFVLLPLEEIGVADVLKASAETDIDTTVRSDLRF